MESQKMWSTLLKEPSVASAAVFVLLHAIGTSLSSPREIFTALIHSAQSPACKAPLRQRPFHPSSSPCSRETCPQELHPSSWPPTALDQMSPVPNEADPEVPRMDPRILIFLLYVMILHELVSGWMEYQKQIAKPKKQAGPVWSSRWVNAYYVSKRWTAQVCFDGEDCLLCTYIGPYRCVCVYHLLCINAQR